LATEAAAAAEHDDDNDDKCCGDAKVGKMEVDEALEKLGTIGRWQILYYTMISITCSVPPCVHMLAIIYIGKYTFCSSHNTPCYHPRIQ